jgi:hypothetical protein
VGTKWNAIPLALLLLIALGWTAVRGKDPHFPHYRLAATTGWPGMNLYERTSR